MSNDANLEEQEMEGEALEAIFSDSFERRSETQPFVWSVKLLPVETDGDDTRRDAENHVGVRLVATLPLDYPEISSPEFDIEVVKGLAEEQRQKLLDIVKEEATKNEGIPVIFACCEVVREWLMDNNFKGQDDGSMYAQMLRKAKEKEKEKELAAQKFEAQKQEEEFTQAELEELAVRKRRAEGTPVTKETFEDWWKRFSAQMEEKENSKVLEKQESTASKKGKGAAQKGASTEEEMSKRKTGFEQFSGKLGLMSMEDFEKELEATTKNNDGSELDVNEELFDDDDDLDDLDFDSDDDDEGADGSFGSDGDDNEEDIDI